MNIQDLTIKQARELSAMFGGTSTDDSHWEIGKAYMIRTVTMIESGRLVAVTPHELVLEEAAWIADTGRFTEAVAKAEFSEVEPYPDGKVIVGRGGIISACQISKTQRTQK